MGHLIKAHTKIGDLVKIFLIKGGEVEGIIIEFGEKHVLLEENAIESFIFYELIGGWQKKTIDGQTSNTSKPTNVEISQPNNEQSQNGNPAPTFKPRIRIFKKEYQIRDVEANPPSVHRLSKVAKELNVSIVTLTNFLNLNGFDLDSNPNEKITDVQYSLVRKEFEGDKRIKEKAILIQKEKEATLNEAQESFSENNEQVSILDNEEVIYEVTQDQYKEVPWKELGTPEQHLFKGREALLEKLKRHYILHNRNKSYILYGLTKSGKSSIVSYLEKSLENENLYIGDKKYKFISFIWQFQEAASQLNASDMWKTLLGDNTLNKIKKLVYEKKVPSAVLPYISGDLRFKHLKEIIQHLKKNNYYPIFLVEEFTFFKTLFESGKLNAAFLSSIREYAVGNLASFAFFGTFDLIDMVKSPTFGITGQLVNTIDENVGRIESMYARQLIDVWSEKLTFDEEAVKHILRLSGSIPFFIQIICKNCAYYALERNKTLLTFKDVEKVTRMLIGEEMIPEKSFLKPLSIGTFNSNQYNGQDPRQVHALVSTMSHFNKDEIIPKGINITDLLQCWGDRKIPKANVRISEALEKLLLRGILWEDSKKGFYKLSVDLFRRWWYNQHPNLDLELNFLFDE